MPTTPSQSIERTARSEAWPSLRLDEWAETYATLHRLTQIAGKIRLARAPLVNHWWNVVLYVTARGLTTSPIPDGQRTFELDFDFIDHRLLLATSTGERAELPLASRPVATFYGEVMAALHALGVDVRIRTRPCEIDDPTPFEQDTRHGTYDPAHASRLFTALSQAHRTLERFRSRFIGKCSPVHFFWGSFDLAVTRFSGRRAPPHPGGIPNLADRVTREAYSHECASCGFWPGGGPMPEPIFYAYAYPEPNGFRDFPVRPEHAYYHDTMREFVLPYERVRVSAEPERMVLDFCQSTYEAAAERGGWDRRELERDAPAA